LGKIFPQRYEVAEETGLELVKIRRLVVYSAPDRDPRMICILVEAEVQGKMKVQDTLEVTEIQAFSPSLPPGQLSHDHNQQLQDYFDGLTKLA